MSALPLKADINRSWLSTCRLQKCSRNIERKHFLLRLWREPLLICARSQRKVNVTRPARRPGNASELWARITILPASARAFRRDD